MFLEESLLLKFLLNCLLMATYYSVLLCLKDVSSASLRFYLS